MSVLSTLGIAVQRLIVLRLDPFGSRQLVTAGRTIAACSIAWLTVTAVFFSLYLNSDIKLAWKLQGLIVPVCILSSVVITGVCYALIYKVVSLSSQTAVLSDSVLSQRMKRNQRILVTFGIVVCSTFVCWFTMCAVLITEYFGESLGIHDKLWFSATGDVGFLLVSLNGILNPLIYWLRLVDFRRQLLRFCGGRTEMTSDSRLVTLSTKGSIGASIRSEAIKGDGDMRGRESGTTNPALESNNV
ncbi:uncharacterized protein [Diadema antillarum]|uniref:uncharacterized protein n=1 Tax=Diadema antillarum TaxID=105358 RepID=UPI003A87314C